MYLYFSDSVHSFIVIAKDVNYDLLQLENSRCNRLPIILTYKCTLVLPISRSIPLYISLQMPTRLLMLTEDSIIYTRNNTTVECYYCINNTRSNLTFWQKTSRQRKIKRLSAFARNVRPRIPYIGQAFHIPISISTLPTRHSTT